MMSRITIDLKKRAQEHIRYDLSRHVVVGDEDGLYCYQLSHIRFRDIITGGKSMFKNTRTPRESTSNRPPTPARSSLPGELQPINPPQNPAKNPGGD